MGNTLMNTTAAVYDGFAGYEDGIEGHERPANAGLIQGTLLKFSNEATWITRDDDEIDGNLELIPVDVQRVVQKWQEGQPIETRTLEAGEKFPDLEALNADVPQSEWVEGPDGHKRGPWQAQHILYLLDPRTMDRFTFPTGTVGGRIGIRELVDKTTWMRRLRGPNVYAVILLADTFMNTKWGGRQRPHFKIVRWVSLGSEGGQVEALPPPTSKERQPDLFANEPAQQSQSDLPLIKEPSLAEEMDDKIPDFESEKAESPKAAAPPLSTPRRNVKKPPAKTGAKEAAHEAPARLRRKS